MTGKRRKPKHEAEPRGIRWGCPKCGCQAAWRLVEYQGRVPVVFRHCRVTRFVDQLVGRGAGRCVRSVPRVHSQGVPVVMGEVNEEGLSEKALDSYKCVDCGHEFSSPRRVC